MAEIKQGRWRADIEGDFVVFLIGQRPSRGRLVKWFRELGGRRGMLFMLKDLTEHPDKGLLGFEMSTFGGIIVQYWRSFEHLEAFANDQDGAHAAAWRTYWKLVGRGVGSGIWHETYLVRAGEFEAVYANMPAYGLGKASSLVRPGDASTARGRLRRRAASA